MGGIKTSYYLCCIFAPSKEFFRENVNYFAEKAEWITANGELDAVRIYKDKYYPKRGIESRYVRVLSSTSLPPFTGDTAIDLAREIMQEYYIYQQCSRT